MLLALDGTLIVQLVNFIVFLAILNVIFMKPVGAAIARRRAYIDSLKHDIETLHGSAQQLQGEADARRLAARREAEELAVKERVTASQEADKLIIAAQTQASEITVGAHAEVAKEVASARAQEPRIVDALATDMLQRALGGVA